MDIDSYLDVDEAIKWRGKPKGGLLLRIVDIFLIPFSLLWGGFASVFFLEFLMIDGGETPVVFPFLSMGFFFFLIGQYFIYGRFIVDAIIRANTDYYVTTQRAIIVTKFLGDNISDMPLTSSLEISVSGRRRGTIKFGPGRGFIFMNPFVLWQGNMHPFCFEQIKNVQEVYKVVRSVQQGK